MSTKQCRIVGRVTYREGDGAEMVIPPGPCEVTLTAVDATISWSDGDTRGSTALPFTEYTRYASTGAISVDE